MPTFKLKDGFGITENVTPGPDLVKYFKDLPDFDLSKINLSKPPAQTVQGGLTFSQPIKIGKSGVELTVGASANGTLSIFVPSSDGAPLFKPDTFGDNIKVAKDQRYVSMCLTAELDGSASASPGDLKFGFNGKSKVNLTYYEEFPANTATLDNVKDTIANFSIPGDLDDIAAMPENSIAAVGSSGSLKFSGSVNLLTLTNPLATATLPANLGGINIKTGVSVDVAADYTFSGDYQVRVQRLAKKTFRIGFYRERDSQFDFTVDAKGSVTAAFANNDLFVKIMQAISSDPQGDLKQLEAAGLPEDRAKAIQSAIKSAVDRSLAIGASLEFSRGDESEAMFLYEVDLNTLQADGRALLHSALEADLTNLVKADFNPPAGIKVLKTLISTKKTFQHSFKLNLLGIYNVANVSTLVIQGTTAWDADTGQLVLTDQATADKIQVITSNLQAKNSGKLRQVLAEHFLFSAAYRAVKNIVAGPPELKGLQSYFDLEANPGKIRMRDYLLISVALGLQTRPAAEGQLPTAVDDFGETSVYAEAGYDDQAFRSLFFDDKGALCPSKIYSDAGRSAIGCLVKKGDDDDFRLAMANDRGFFDKLAQIGNVQSAGFANACVAAGVPKALVPVVGTDYLNVAWFSEAMVTAGKGLQAIDTFLQQNPNTDPQNHDFTNLKGKLAKSLGSVVERATVDFGGPWGFETMASLGKASSKKWMLVNRYITSTLSAGEPKPAQSPAKVAAPSTAGGTRKPGTKP
jgi:hypothetical protein